MPISPYAGNPATFPATIGLVDDSVQRNATNLNVAPQGLADRTANLNAHKLTKDAADAITGDLHVTAPGALTIDLGATEEVAGSLSISGLLHFEVGSHVDGTITGGFVTLAGGGLRMLGGVISAEHIGSVIAAAANAIIAGVAAGITDGGVPGGIQTVVRHGIQLGGGADDFVGFTAVRTKSFSFPPRPLDASAVDGVHWVSCGPPPVFPARGLFGLVGNKTPVGIYLELCCPHEGALLASVAVSFNVVDPHASGVPLNLPTISVFRYSIAPGISTVSETLSVTEPQSYSPIPANGGAWYDGQNTKRLVYNCDRNNLIDNVNYVYYIAITDEHGAASAAGNGYTAVTATYTNIPDMRFPC